MYNIPIHSIRLCREGTLKHECKTAEHAAEIMSSFAGDFASEVFVVCALNAQLVVTSISQVHLGKTDGTMASIPCIFKFAIAANACSIIIGHNHPSGNTSPSESDVETTHGIVHAGSILGIPVIDHIIFAESGNFKSLKTMGYI